MATWPAKINYTTGGILTASQMNDIGGELNDLYTTAGKAAGKNKIINGDFNINQRAFSSSIVSGYLLDRFNSVCTSGTYTLQQFTPGAAPVAGYEATNFLQIATTGQSATSDRTLVLQNIEDVRTFAGQTTTFSFWAKATSGTPKVSIELVQNFGSGGSTSVTAIGVQQFTLSTSWTRYTSNPISVPSISGKTIGTSSMLSAIIWTSAGSDFNARTSSLGLQTATTQFWGWQLEAGSVATAFQTATGTIQGELAACQRYYYASGSTGNPTNYFTFGNGPCYSTTQANILINFPVMMRTAPSYSATGTINLTTATNGAQATSSTALDAASTTTAALTVTANSAGLVAGNATRLYSVNDANARLQFSAEL